MMPYGAYQQYQIERPKSAAEIRRANEQMGELSRTLSSAWLGATRPAGALLALAERRRTRDRARQTAPSHLALSEPQTAAAGHCGRATARC
jgi:hypothetical protein